MKYFLTVYLLLSPLLFATDFSFTKTLLLTKPVVTPTLARFKIDHDIYKHTQSSYADIRLYSKDKEIGYFLKKPQVRVENRQVLSTSAYNRDKTTLTYDFKKSFLIEEIKLSIQNRDFETKATLVIDGMTIRSNIALYDYSKETGNRNFTIKINPTLGKNIEIMYDLNQTHFFTPKKKEVSSFVKYLSIHSATFINYEVPNVAYDATTISPLSVKIQDKEGDYVFGLNNIDIHHIGLQIQNHNYKRSGEVFVSNDNKKWRYLKSFTISASTLMQHKQNMINIQTRSKYLKLHIHNHNNSTLDIQKITLFTQPTYLYFIAEKEKNYTLKFGNELLVKPHYDIEALVNELGSFVNVTSKMLEHHTKVVKIPTFFERYKHIFFTLGILFAVAVLLYIALVLLKKEEA